MAALSAVAKFPQLYSQVFDKNSKLHGDSYKGWLRINFWQYGEWVEIIIDDKLPVNPNTKTLLYGSCTNPNNFWVPLIEKAYAKLMGSYKNMISGNSVRALIDLTGLVFISFNPGLLNTLPERYEIEDQLSHVNLLVGACSIRFKKEGSKSDEDFDGHAYAILCINKIQISQNDSSRTERVYTIRNPHGKAKEGSRWSSDHQIWKSIDQDSKKKVFKNKCFIS